MTQPPAYFEAIRSKAAQRWDQLEGDPDLAGPWHQLFKQVQSPRHILSELLQNADDAGATEASVELVNGRFVFEHNGEDFIEAHFASLCRFGYSNKRALHTIGFRGIGFKSTFSLGDRVELYTPSLAVAFSKRRFTEPSWISGVTHPSRSTRVEVEFAHERLQRDVEKNLDEWLTSPFSLLFFKNVRRLAIGETEMTWDSLGPGPVENSEWMALNNGAEKPYLHVRSELAEFPEDALEEIRGERMLPEGDELSFPPCRVEIVVGARGRLYVVLPTGVSTSLPFAVNAPFIQDPARMKIKDPETSPTNRWLLDRVGALAAHAMDSWLGNEEIGLVDRTNAYDLLPDVDRNDTTLEGSCATIVEVAFEGSLDDVLVLLTEAGERVEAGSAVHIPAEVCAIWEGNAPSRLLDHESRPPFASAVTPDNLTKLLRWDWLTQITKNDFIEALETTHLPLPSGWDKLFELYAYIAPEVTGYWCDEPEDLHIVPVAGLGVLYSANEVVRLGERKLALHSDDDWAFLSERLKLVDRSWLEYLERRNASNFATEQVKQQVEEVLEVVEAIGLDKSTEPAAILGRVATAYFAGSDIKLVDCVRLAQIAAKLNAPIDDGFKFVARDRKLYSAGQQKVIYDATGALEDFIPESEVATRFLHENYTSEFASCSEEEWRGWVAAGRSRLLSSFPIRPVTTSVYGRTKIEREASSRGYASRLDYHYKTDRFEIDDWDFPKSYWDLWTSLEAELPEVWTAIARQIFAQPESYWRTAQTARIYHVATNGSKKSIAPMGMRASWLCRLAELPCLADVYGMPTKPSNLLLRVPETEAFLDVEPFVDSRMDEGTNKQLLKLLGVRSTPTGPSQLLERLLTLSAVAEGPASEAERWYRRLDQLIDNCTAQELSDIRTAFREQRIIRGHDGSWQRMAGVAISVTEDDVPGSVAIMPSVAALHLWQKIGVPDRPTFERALGWLASLPSGEVLASEDQGRVRGLLGRYPSLVLEATGHWLALSGRWAPFDSLKYSVSMQTLARWKHLHDWVKDQTANLQALSGEWLSQQPFSALEPLHNAIDETLSDPVQVTPENSSQPSWLKTFGRLLQRVEINSDQSDRVRARGARLAETRQCETKSLEIVPYVGGVPAGTPRQSDILWLEGTLFLATSSRAKRAKLIPEEIANDLSNELKSAAAYSYERSSADIEAYMHENFQLGPDMQREHRSTPLVEPDSVDDDASLPLEETDHSTPDVELIVLDGESIVIEQPIEHDPVPDEGPSDGPSTPDPRPRDLPIRRIKPQQRPLLERFAEKQGFQKDGNSRFYHSDGRWISRSAGMSFPWVMHSKEGEVERYLYDRDHCLEEEPLEIPAEIWGLVDSQPTTYCFVLVGADGAPLEMMGTSLQGMRDEGKLRIHPATYRLVHADVD